LLGLLLTLQTGAVLSSEMQANFYLAKCQHRLEKSILQEVPDLLRNPWIPIQTDFQDPATDPYLEADKTSQLPQTIFL
jgi:hypothetical protein